MHALVRKSSFSKAQGLRETDSWCSVDSRYSDEWTILYRKSCWQLYIWLWYLQLAVMNWFRFIQFGRRSPVLAYSIHGFKKFLLNHIVLISVTLLSHLYQPLCGTYQSVRRLWLYRVQSFRKVGVSSLAHTIICYFCLLSDVETINDGKAHCERTADSSLNEIERNRTK